MGKYNDFDLDIKKIEDNESTAAVTTSSVGCSLAITFFSYQECTDLVSCNGTCTCVGVATCADTCANSCGITCGSGC